MNWSNLFCVLFSVIVVSFAVVAPINHLLSPESPLSVYVSLYIIDVDETLVSMRPV